MRILAADTSTRTGSVAVLAGENLLAEVLTTGEQTHAKRLMAAIDRTLKMAGMTVEDCDGFAVTTGPGSFTGLRIGISTVKGLAFATQKPVSSVSTLDALAYQFPSCRHLVCPILDARKGQIYTALYECGPDMKLNKIVHECAVEPRIWLQKIEHSCLLVGDGTTAYGDLIREMLGTRAHFAPSYLNVPRASVVGFLGLKQLVEGRNVDVSVLEPFYIRKSDAEIKNATQSKDIDK